MKRTIIAAVVSAVIVVGVFFLVVRSGAYLVVNHPQKSDVILVLAKDRADIRYWRSIQLLRAGYGDRIILDASKDRIWGRTYAEYAADFVARTSGELAAQIRVCIVRDDSPLLEATDAAGCLAQSQPPPRSVLIVANDYDTRRALSIFRNRLPQYRWSVAAVHDDDVFGERWWRQREWAKTNVTEWEKLLCWELLSSGCVM